ncbi:hypothetical protein F5X98DRAFT_274537 [Xylaria grammica]|nr:hypothetical protein F5X98DRAFT_274537 [Xylaria grammica]
MNCLAGGPNTISGFWPVNFSPALAPSLPRGPIRAHLKPLSYHSTGQLTLALSPIRRVMLPSLAPEMHISRYRPRWHEIQLLDVKRFSETNHVDLRAFVLFSAFSHSLLFSVILSIAPFYALLLSSASIFKLVTRSYKVVYYYFLFLCYTPLYTTNVTLGRSNYRSR